jgi:hypothetical protein
MPGYRCGSHCRNNGPGSGYQVKEQLAGIVEGGDYRKAKKAKGRIFDPDENTGSVFLTIRDNGLMLVMGVPIIPAIARLTLFRLSQDDYRESF